MSGEVAKTKSSFIPAPVDGLNLTQIPFITTGLNVTYSKLLPGLQATEARDLTNYYVFDWGIRQRGAANLVKNYATELFVFVSFVDGSGADKMIICTDNKMYRMANITDTAPTALVLSGITNNFWRWSIFNKHIFFFNNTDAGWIYDITAGTIANDGFTGPTSGSVSLLQHWSYKDRLYAVQGNSTIFWYGGVDAITGAMTSVDLGTIFQRSGKLLCGFSWTYNQGQLNSDICVFLSDQGEVLFYSGSYPGDAAWTFIGRTFIPKPRGDETFQKVGQDVYILTSRGIIPISQVFSGRNDFDYFTVSRNLGPFMNDVIGVDRGFADSWPFLYYVSGDGMHLYVLNYERGAWSKLDLRDIVGGGDFIECCMTFGGLLFIGLHQGKMYNLPAPDSGTSSNTINYSWKTPFLNFGTQQQKHSKMIRVLGRDKASSPAAVSNRVSISSNFVDPASPAYDSANTVVTDSSYQQQELAPPGSGRWLSYCFSQSTASTVLNEIQGFDVIYEEGGYL